MGNIKHNDELLRIHDDGFDVVFNCDNKHQNGVSYHAEKNGKKTKIDPEYAMAALVKKVSGAGWPVDLPKPSEGGYGYTTTKVTNEVELICEGPVDESYDDVSWSDHIECPEGLIIGEHYEVTVNGVTGTYECFDDNGYPTLGYKYNEMTESYEHGLWQIYIDASEDYSDIIAGMNLLPGETATFIVKVLNEVHHKVEPKYLPEGGVGWTERVNTVVFDNIEGDVFNSGDDIRTEFLPIDVDFESIYDKFINGANITVTVNGVMYTNTSAEKSGNYIDIYFWEEGSSADSPDAGNLHSSITDGWVIYDSWGTEIAPIGLATFGLSIEEEIIHAIDPKYFDAYDAVFICEENIHNENPVFNLEYGDYQKVMNKLKNGIMPKIKIVYKYDTGDDSGDVIATPVAISKEYNKINIMFYEAWGSICMMYWYDDGDVSYYG